MKIIRVFIDITFVVYIIVLLAITLRPDFIGQSEYRIMLQAYLKNNSNFVPFRTIGGYMKALRDGSPGMNIPMRNLVGNLVLLFPLAIYLPFFFSKMRSFKADFMAVLGIDVIIEILQCIFRIGSIDVDDVLLNMLGAAFGYAAWKWLFFRIATRLKLIQV